MLITRDSPRDMGQPSWDNPHDIAVANINNYIMQAAAMNN
jgi:hypothetical protein